MQGWTGQDRMLPQEVPWGLGLEEKRVAVVSAGYGYGRIEAGRRGKVESLIKCDKEELGISTTVTNTGQEDQTRRDKTRQNKQVRVRAELVESGQRSRSEIRDQTHWTRDVSLRRICRGRFTACR
jgi:hypothetical protein